MEKQSFEGLKNSILLTEGGNIKDRFVKPGLEIYSVALSVRTIITQPSMADNASLQLSYYLVILYQV
jgi:hypothetical protein